MLNGRSEVILQLGNPVLKEAFAKSALNPGHLLEFTGNLEIQPHSTALGQARAAFVMENSNIGGTINDSYAANDRVRYIVCPAGVEVQAKVAAGHAAIAQGDTMTASNDGTLKVASDAADVIVAFALEAVDNSSGTTEAFIIVEVK